MKSPANGGEPFLVELHHSRPALLAIDEPQVLYTLVTIRPGKESDKPLAPPLNLCVAIDRSTSMAGERLDTARASVSEILRQLRPQDRLSLVTFSDRAEVLIPGGVALNPGQAQIRLNQIQASGSTEIFQGVSAGIAEIRGGRQDGAVDHLILLTDGHTYGDEEKCLTLAEEAAAEGVELTAVGIGQEWNDSFLDLLAAKTGGNAVYIDQVSTLTGFLRQKFHGLGLVYADQLTLEIETSPGVMLHSAFRTAPAPTPLPNITFLRLGSLFQGTSLCVLLQFLFSPLEPAEELEVCKMTFGARVVPSNEVLQSSLALSMAVAEDVPATPIAGSLLTAARGVALYELQEKADQDVQAGHFDRATRRLNRLATQLLELGESELANTIIAESERLNHERNPSPAGHKRVKYGTRGLMDAKAEVQR